MRFRRLFATTEEKSREIVSLIVFLGVIQFFLNGAQLVLAPRTMFWMWTATGVVSMLVLVRIERYFARRRRLGRG